MASRMGIPKCKAAYTRERDAAQKLIKDFAWLLHEPKNHITEASKLLNNYIGETIDDVTGMIHYGPTHALRPASVNGFVLYKIDRANELYTEIDEKVKYLWRTRDQLRTAWVNYVSETEGLSTDGDMQPNKARLIQEMKETHYSPDDYHLDVEKFRAQLAQDRAEIGKLENRLTKEFPQESGYNRKPRASAIHTNFAELA
ncbi:hypothetical protein DFH27DRAFT_609932 [Peziza echinospora]|nr:hypothetical protein DFH27DRAFT_609932 [Peziza echinospora]